MSEDILTSIVEKALSELARGMVTRIWCEPIVLKYWAGCIFHSFALKPSART